VDAPTPQPAGYSGTPLDRKLGLKAGQRIVFENAPADGWVTVPEGVTVLKRAAEGLDVAVTFVTERKVLERRLQALRPKLNPAGMIWVAWPKKASKVPTDVTEDVVREIALSGDLVDVKVCAIDATWSGLKLVIRKEAR
jgi:hypothetical protein